jgi:hypothetical protein
MQAPGAGTGIPGQPAVGNEAARIIGQLLTTPRPGGLAGVPGPGGANPSAFGAAGGGQTFGGGIAGVASKSEARGIKVFNERENYNEWEFVYDYRKDPLIVGSAGTVGSNIGQQIGQPVGPGGIGQPSPFGTPGALGQPSVFGQPGVAGQPAGFGQPGFGQPGFGQHGFGQPGFGQPGFGQQPGQTPISPAQPGLPGSPFGPPQGRRPAPILTPGNPAPPPQPQPRR